MIADGQAARGARDQGVIDAYLGGGPAAAETEAAARLPDPAEAEPADG